MIDHLIVTVSDFDRSKAFYKRALAPLGMTATAEFPWGPAHARGVDFGREDKEFFVVQGSPINRPIHVAFPRGDAGRDAGVSQRGSGCWRSRQRRAELSPGHHADYLSAYVVDPDGHNVDAVCHQPE